MLGMRTRKICQLGAQMGLDGRFLSSACLNTLRASLRGQEMNRARLSWDRRAG